MLSSGTRLGPYEILKHVGSGGMGEVYRARDTRLDRIVAIKVLRPELAESFGDHFAREARAVSQLNHPHICTLHDVGESNDCRYLVMEFVEGETLAARLARDRPGLDAALDYAVQIASALDAAHRHRIVHGDLKPGNVMLTRTGAKLLDFGLAREFPAGRGQAPGSDTMTRAQPLAAAPVLGTLPYLAPEQLEEKPVDARTDIFAFGALVYEMVTGLRAFGGDSHAAVVAAILRVDPPPMSASRPGVPAALERVVATCLAKDPDARWQNAGDLAREVRWIAGGGAVEGTVPTVASRRQVWVVAAGVLALMALALVGGVLLGGRGTAAVVYRTSVLLPAEARFPGAGQLGGTGRFALSPDGRRLVFVAAAADGISRLWIRPLDESRATPLAGTEGAGSPFWAPDSRRIGFVAQGMLKTVDTSGGPPQSLVPAFGAVGSWNGEDLILFTPDAASPLHVIPALGGASVAVTTLDTEAGEVLHRNPVFLSDGRRFLYVATAARSGQTTGARAVHLGSLDGDAPTARVLEVGSTVALGEGALFFLRDGRVVAQPFDESTGRLTGVATPVTEQVALTGPLSPAVSVSAGVLAYQPASGPLSELVWMDRAGRRLAGLGEPADYADLDISPDGRQAVASVLDEATNTRDVWVFDLVRQVRTRVTFDPAEDMAPVWSADGRSVLFASNRTGHFDIYRKASTGVGADELVFADEAEKFPTSASPDGRALLYGTFDAEGAWLRLLPLAGGTATPLLGPFSNSGVFSPDGRWIAYASTESGRSDVYVVSAADASRRWQLSPAGGSLPRWSPNSREIIYLGSDNWLRAAPLDDSDDTLVVGVPTALFEARPTGQRGFFDISADGGQLLLNTYRGDSVSSSITILQNVGALVPR